jgi:signal recognition particle receptor subunit beta
LDLLDESAIKKLFILLDSKNTNKSNAASKAIATLLQSNPPISV